MTRVLTYRSTVSDYLLTLGNGCLTLNSLQYRSSTNKWNGRTDSVALFE
jgi:hypothetical protein